jgi:hypothetical protein
VQRVRYVRAHIFQLSATESFASRINPVHFVFRSNAFCVRFNVSWQAIGFIREQVLCNQLNYGAEAIQCFSQKCDWFLSREISIFVGINNPGTVKRALPTRRAGEQNH